MVARKYLTLAEAALIARVSVSTVKHWCAVEKIRSTRGGRHRLILEEHLYAFLDGDAVARR